MDPKTPTFNVALKSTERQWVQKIPEVYTNDLHSVSLQFRITDCTDAELTGSTAIVLLKMRDGSFFQGPSVDVTRTLNVFSYTLKENEGNHDGLAEIQLIVTIGAKEFATQKYNFKVISGLDSEVAREIMIHDWTTLTREARAYIDEFAANEILREAEFDNAQFGRNGAFNAAQTQRNTDFGTDQAQRVSDFNAAEAARVLAFNNAEAARAAGYDADHSRAETDHTGAVEDRTNAATDRTNAETDRTNAAADRTLAGTDHTRAESDHTRANTDSATVAGFNTRLTAEETATANNKISAVKSKTFADVDARFEDVETDTTLMGTNLVTNGNFSNGASGWVAFNLTTTVAQNEATLLASSSASMLYRNIPATVNGKLYVSALVKSTSNLVGINLYGGLGVKHSGSGNYERLSQVITPTLAAWQIGIKDTRASGYDNVYVKNYLTIDLTATFGAGNEPTVEQMDAIMAKFENSWFDGTKNLFQAKASLNKLMALDARTEFEARNLVSNGDFSNGTTGWTANNSTLSANNNTLSTTGNNTSATVGAIQNYNKIIGNKYYVTAKARVTNSDATSISIYTGVPAAVLNTPIINTWYKLSGIFTATSYQSVVINNAYINTATANGKTMDIQYITLIDLTAAFGAGKEPTLAEMDRLMARFPNSWFDGVKPIQTIDTLYREKANKAQEAWITPTLLNGWIAGAFGTPQYMLDELGFVHLRGSIKNGVVGQAAFTLPTGYRPSSIKAWISTSGYEAFNTGFITTSGLFAANKLNTNGDTVLDNISFKVGA